MKTYRGSAIIEYVLPLVLVGVVVGLGIFYLASDNKLKYYFANSGGYEVDKSTGKLSNKLDNNTPLITNNIKTVIAGSLGGTPEKPEIQCKSGTCDIDLGNFILQGVPDDYSEIIETAGASGGTETAAELLLELSDTIEVDEQTKNNIKKLAQLGYQIADIEQQIEDINQTINPKSVQKQGVGRFRARTQTVTEYMRYGQAKTYQQPLRDLSAELKNGDIVREYNQTKVLVEKALGSSYNVNDENVKNLLGVLSTEIVELKDTVASKADKLVTKLDQTPRCTGRACMGNKVNERDFKPESKNYFSKDIVRTDLDSQIICKTGHGQSNHKKRRCH